ncbi:benzoate 4-monooxygenase [Fusarium graminearum PH-1]|uniref:benzoate 4-monooxygenase n=1 Tax=Gibberella zeae (strain ATCC MYA-4620 / CBS 123657 / FGSC 9075 / NRRL 31084 / PH-1) TaxID=229533 RepID=UPI00021F138B|nr:benzoate 4-monooxygenase [Fusarium graminearum PH-1]ESU17167.1 benzoate 4-monooxygenase [Fusarium graminearum PH-1]|eukprot:XP_011319429.1 benzoate 4-monooxygenase [Fusarium graminearum PH-1]
MAIVDLLFTWWSLPIAAGLVAASYLYSYFITYGHLRDIPAPFPAQFSNLWLLYVCRRGERYRVVDQIHKELGPVVRIQPNHTSIADAEAIATIYGHGNGLFNTRDRAEHTRKRKLISHVFSAKSISQFEPYIHANLELFVKQLDKLVASGQMAKNGKREALMDCLPWFNYLAFDVIGDLAFGVPFGMLASGADVAEVRDTPDSPPIYASAIEILNRRGEVSATLGCFPQLKPYAQYLPDPFFSNGLNAVKNLAGIAIARVKNRLDNPPSIERMDLLARLMEGRDEKGEPLGREELTAEALTQLIAGSDTTSNSSCALLYHVTRTPGVLEKLQSELDNAIPSEVSVPTYDMVRDLPYLANVINETLRYHSTSGIGLPRQIPPNSPGVTIKDHFFPPGSILSVPTYTLHHSKEIWGADADDFRPERWENPTELQKTAFNPFSHGPRACVGRNVAEMEMKLIAATWARRYVPELRQGVMETREGFLRKPLGLDIALMMRE